MSGTLDARARKFRQAAFVYLHVGLLYEAAVLVIARQGLLEDRGPVWVWLLAGAAVVAVVFWALWSLQNAWVARAVWAANVFRLPALIGGAFFAAPAAGVPPSFYMVALGVVVGNMWMLARAGWDL
ncbi:MAG: hypothetical protein KY453_00110 [Gemmatimonadetes bacterium]|nr:hypothetical protein [Gemmatimonadota bacterium]